MSEALQKALDFIVYILKSLTWWNLVSMFSMVWMIAWVVIASYSEGEEVRTAMIRSDINWLAFLIAIIGGQLERNK